MKATILSAILSSCIGLMSFGAEPVREYGHIHSEPVANVKAELQWKIPGKLPCDEAFFLVFLKTDSVKARLVRPKDEFFLRMTLVDSAGVIVPKTRKGRSYGGKFDELPATLEEKNVVLNRRGRFQVYVAADDGGTSLMLPSLSELFRIQANQDYTLHVELQMFQFGAASKADRLLRFPALTVPVRCGVEQSRKGG